MMPVTRITQDATLDSLASGDYADIYQELRQTHSLDKLVAALGSTYSKAQWHKYEREGATLTRTMRNELRAYVGLPLLPMTVAEATAQASPDAAVWQVGDGVPEHVIMVGASPVTLHVNGTVQAVAPDGDVTLITSPPRNRTAYVRPCVPLAYAERLQALESVSWLEVIEAGLREFEV